MSNKTRRNQKISISAVVFSLIVTAAVLGGFSATNNESAIQNRSLYERLLPYEGKTCVLEKNTEWGLIDVHLGTGPWKITGVGPDYITIADSNGVREFTFPNGTVVFRNLNN